MVKGFIELNTTKGNMDEGQKKFIFLVGRRDLIINWLFSE
jgi:hypothetical protein